MLEIKAKQSKRRIVKGEKIDATLPTMKARQNGMEVV